LEIIADNLKKRGWSYGYVSAVDSQGRTIWIAEAGRGDGKRFVVRADEKLTAFVELEAAIRFAMRCGLACPSIRARELAALQEQMHREAAQWDSANGSKP
jgi:hypothetical protein